VRPKRKRAETRRALGRKFASAQNEPVTSAVNVTPRLTAIWKLHDGAGEDAMRVFGAFVRERPDTKDSAQPVTRNSRLKSTVGQVG
jgi:hypothetical protein